MAAGNALKNANDVAASTSPGQNYGAPVRSLGDTRLLYELDSSLRADFTSACRLAGVGVKNGLFIVVSLAGVLTVARLAVAAVQIILYKFR